MPFPRKLYNIPFYKQKYDACKARYLAEKPAGMPRLCVHSHWSPLDQLKACLPVKLKCRVQPTPLLAERMCVRRAVQQCFISSDNAAGQSSVSLVAFPDAASPHDRTWQCPKPGCSTTETQPKSMANHLAEHAEYHQATLNLGTIRYSISQGEVSIQHRSRKIQKADAQLNLDVADLIPRKQRGKRNKPEQHDDKLDQLLTAITKVQKEFAAEKETSRKKQDQMIEVMMCSVKNQDELLKQLASKSSNSIRCPSPNISLAQAEAIVQMHKTWKANAVEL